MSSANLHNQYSVLTDDQILYYYYLAIPKTELKRWEDEEPTEVGGQEWKDYHAKRIAYISKFIPVKDYVVTIDWVDQHQEIIDGQHRQRAHEFLINKGLIDKEIAIKVVDLTTT